LAKLVLDDLANLRNETTAIARINNNLQKIEDALENTLSRDGTSPNVMNADLDVNGNFIRNHPEPVNDVDLSTKGYVDGAIAEALSLESSIADTLVDIQTAQTAAEAAQTAAETAETNAETAETNAETAATSATNSATAAAASAAAAALDGGELTFLDSNDNRQTIYNEAGYAVIDVPADVLDNPSYEEDQYYWCSQEDTGTVIHKESTIDAGPYSMTSPYTPFMRTWFWVRRVQNGASPYASISWDRRVSPDQSNQRVTLDTTNGLIVPSTVASNYVLLVPGIGHSDSQGSPDNSAFTTSAIDTGNALMLDGNSTDSPYIGTQSMATYIDLKHQAGVGETPFAGAADAWLTGLDAYGSKIPTIFGSVGVGGSSLHDLLSTDRMGYYANLERWIQRCIYYVRANGKIPIFGPLLLFHFDPSDAGPYGDLKPAAMYLSHLKQLHTQYNRTVRAFGGLHPDSPDLPIIGPQSTEEDSAMWSGSNKVFDLDYDGSRMAHFLSLLRPDGFTGFICCGPTYQFQNHTDNQHLTSMGNYQSGVQAGKYMLEYALRAGRKPIYPYQIVRDSNTQFTIHFTLPTGQSLVLDTTTVSDFADTFKGFVCWREDTAAAVTITSVALSGTDKVVIQHSSTTAQMWVDYARWASSAAYQTGRSITDGPRGCLRGNVLTTSTSGTSFYEYSMAFRAPVPTGTATWSVEKAMARYI
jgi:hypothetical protein